MTSFFRGKVSFAFKLVVLLLIGSVLVTLIQSAFAQGEFLIAAFLAIAVLLMVITYLTKVSIPLKFFLPGVLLLVAFVLSPIIFTVTMSGYNYKTGNITSKEEAIEQIQNRGFESDADGTSFDIKIGRYQAQEALLVSDSINNVFFISTVRDRIPLNPADLTINEFGVAQSAPEFEVLTDSELGSADKVYSGKRFTYQDEFFISIEGFDNIISGEVYVDNGRGNYAIADNPDLYLEPGWRAPVWFENYTKLFTEERLRGPLVSVFIWTIIFASLSVITTFALGLLLALALNKPIRGRRVYRSILILPYAMPSIMSILIWGGMFNTEFGAINNLLGTDIAWFQNALFAKFAIILVNLWLGFPYFYLVSSGALQAIPSELLEAAAIDGANPRQIFRRITLPLLLQILSPLLIASFAFNFNNFNLIYLLTGGGPRSELDGELAGATDILISFTYKIAFGSSVQDLGLASAISLVIFLLIASISLYGLRKSKVLESFQ
jgi:arabinogalactan oligomer/maltooligosaccharide transport system permease protein